MRDSIVNEVFRLGSLKFVNSVIGPTRLLHVSRLWGVPVPIDHHVKLALGVAVRGG